MSDIVQKLRQSYHLDTVQPEHPVLRAVREIERLREEAERMRLLAVEARRDADALRRDGACPHIVSTAEGTHHCALATAPRFAHTYCSQCGSDLGPGDSGVSHCADHRKAALAAAPQVEQEPYCYIYEYDGAFGLHREFYPGTYNGKKPSRTVPLYTSPPQRKPLTEEEIEVLDCIPNVPGILIGDVVKFARAIERAHGIGGSK